MTTTTHHRSTPTYLLPGGLSPFQNKLYRHLIDWKWAHGIKEPGKFRKTNKAGVVVEYLYDAMLPEDFATEQRWPHLHPAAASQLRRHMGRNKFRIHNHFYHMASSQAANLNLFLPLLIHRDAAAILRALRPDFASLATDALDNGYCVEYWGGNFAPSGGKLKDASPLRDKTARTGTDADIAIAYRNLAGELCLWLVEHKLTEQEFTACGGAKSKGRTAHHSCAHGLGDILADKSLCYYHDVNKYAYWDITEANRELFVGHAAHTSCPFKGGMNQLWRNLLLARALEAQGDYKHVFFSVVRHPDNHALDGSLKTFQELIGGHPSFSTLTSREVVVAAERLDDPELNAWAQWYRDLYKV
ncbi:hypothetical protein EYB53_013470 [Candidatus Chloroploca sp. M-50]|uniref:Uncharacterized protein n=1 Tax=Candidatus Chloroploca mongolica TaxID=2528176 RepID=A0ABS4DB94_9CHLR|nr:hypothetical protein [Candidatus Chloroploca mongolica]MBP1466720.1 hypothetical protein [Candidatus Chloroploca mongolica]